MSVQRPAEPAKTSGAKSARVSVPDLVARKGQEPIVCLTAYTAPMARMLDGHVDLLLVGDSLGMVLYGLDSTIPVTLDMMVQHGAAVCRGSKQALVVVDMPFGSYQESPAQAFASAARLMKETGCQAVKLEGGRAMAPTVEFLVARGQGVWWHTQQPFESTLVVTKTRVFTRNPDGSATSLMDAQAQPGLQQVSELIFSLLAADLDALGDRFNVVAQPAGVAGWSLVLTPRDASIARFLVRATLAGERDVQSVRIEEARGDTTQIRFSRQVTAPALAADEASRFQ